MRPRSPLLARLSALLGTNPDVLQAELQQWPEPGALAECRPGPRTVWHDKAPTPPMRVLFELMFDQPMHASWRLLRLCPTRHCCQPAHWGLKLIRGPDMAPLPVKLDHLLEAELTLDDVIDMILMVDGRQGDPTALAERFDVSVDLINQALAQIREEGL